MSLAKLFKYHLDADRMAAHEVQELFAPPPEFEACLRPENQLLLGPKGSGKSIALKGLSFNQIPTAELNSALFFGVLVSIGRYQVDFFKQGFNRTHDPRPFFSYFNLFLLNELCRQLSVSESGRLLKIRLPAAFHTSLSTDGSFPPTLDFSSPNDVQDKIDDLMDRFARLADLNETAIATLPPLDTLSATTTLLGRLQRQVQTTFGTPRLALLFDGFDHLGDLGVVFASLFAKDEPFSEWLITKAACRELPRYFHVPSLQTQLEAGRDYQIIPVGLYDDLHAFQAHLQQIIQQRSRHYLGTEASSEVGTLLPHDATESPSGFDSLAQFAGGSVLVLLETCALAAAQHEDDTDIPPAAQRTAIKKRARLYLTADLADQVGKGAAQLRDLLRAVSLYLRREVEPRTRALTVDSSTLAAIENLEIDPREAIAILCEFRYLRIDSSQLPDFLLRRTFSIPFNCTLSPTLAPELELPLHDGAESYAPVAAEDIDHWVGVLRRQQPLQTTLFSVPDAIFLSVPGGEWGMVTERRLKDAYRRILTQKGRSPTPAEQVSLILTFRSVARQKTGNFQDNLLDAIRDARYVVLDVTMGPTAGVLIELGIVAGFKRAHALCWFQDRPWPATQQKEPFDEELVPPPLSSTDIKIRVGGGEAFYHWFESMVHVPCTQINEMCAFRGSGENCLCSEEIRSPGQILVCMLQENLRIKEALAERLLDSGLTPVFPDSSAPLSDRDCRLIRSSEGIICDITLSSQIAPERFAKDRPEVAQLIRIGYSMAAGIPHALIYDEDKSRLRASMLPGNRRGILPSTLGKSVADFVEWFTRFRLGRDQRA